MKRLTLVFLTAALAAMPAAAAEVRYDFAGTLTNAVPGGAVGDALAAEAGLASGSGSFSGFVIFDSAATDQDPSGDVEVYSPTSFALNFAGGYGFSSGSAGDSASSRVGFTSSEFGLIFNSTRDFSPSASGEFLDFSLLFGVPGIAGGVAQSPLAANGSVSFTIFENDGSFLFADGAVTQIDVTQDPIPEPATWALMIGGFGLAGAALRRRRTFVVA